jgi:hypothetical protein
MKKIWEWIKSNPNRTMFLIPIILVAGISISHVVSWYNIANPLSWAIYLSIAIEVGAMTALVAATNKIKGGVWFMFGLVTLIQMIGNIFFSYKEIDPNGDLFKSWVELTGPVWEMIGSDPSDIPAMKRWLSFLEGGLLPVISLTSLHFFVKYEDKKEDTPQVEDDTNVTHKEDTDQVTDQVEVMSKPEETLDVLDETLDIPEVESETQITDLVDDLDGTAEIGEIMEEESLRYFDIQENLIPSTTTTTNDGVRRLTYTKPS